MPRIVPISVVYDTVVGPQVKSALLSSLTPVPWSTAVDPRHQSSIIDLVLRTVRRLLPITIYSPYEAFAHQILPLLRLSTSGVLSGLYSRLPISHSVQQPVHTHLVELHCSDELFSNSDSETSFSYQNRLLAVALRNAITRK